MNASSLPSNLPAPGPRSWINKPPTLTYIFHVCPPFTSRMAVITPCATSSPPGAIASAASFADAELILGKRGNNMPPCLPIIERSTEDRLALGILIMSPINSGTVYPVPGIVLGLLLTSCSPTPGPNTL